MRTCSQLLLYLLTCAVRGESADAVLSTPMSDAEVNDVYQLAKKHDLAHLIGAALEMAEAEDKQRYKPFFSASIKAAYRYEWLRGEQEKIFDLLEQKEIPYIPLKGAVIRALYPEPWHRTSCDIDILIPEERLEEAIAAFESDLAYTCGIRSRYDVAMNAPNGVHLELHFDIYREYIDRSEVWADARQVTARDYQFALSTELLILAHIAHMAKHFVNGGCGVRPFLDLYLMREKLQYDAEKLSQMLDSHHLSEFGEVVFGIVAVWFDQKTPTETEIIAQDFVVSGGAYGNLYNRISVTRSKQNVFYYYFQKIFPPFSVIRASYPILHKHPWLLPVCWIYRWIRLIRPDRRKMIKTEYAINRRLGAGKLQNIDDLMKYLNLKK